MSQVVGDAQANLLRMLFPRGQPGNMITGEVKVTSYHRLDTTLFSSVATQLIEGNGLEARQTSKEQTKMPRLRLESPRPCTIFCFALIHYA